MLYALTALGIVQRCVASNKLLCVCLFYLNLSLWYCTCCPSDCQLRTPSLKHAGQAQSCTCNMCMLTHGPHVCTARLHCALAEAHAVRA